MTIALTLLGAMLFPVATLVLLLWLTRLEETLDRDVEAARRKPAPAPILAIAVHVVGRRVMVARHEQRRTRRVGQRRTHLLDARQPLEQAFTKPRIQRVFGRDDVDALQAVEPREQVEVRWP